MGLEGEIWASRLGFGPQGWDMGLEARGRGGAEEKKEEKKEKIPHMCESIGH